MRVAPMILGLRRIGIGVALLAVTGAGQCGPAAAADTFAGFAGRWAGTGAVAMTDGSRENIRCQAKYSTGAGRDSLHVNVRCASDSYRVHLLIDVEAQGDQISGSWQETTHQVSGDVTGQLPGSGQIQASLSGLGFGIQLAATTNGRQQAVTIQSQNTEVQTVKITMRKS